jgi:hypothetical protein
MLAPGIPRALLLLQAFIELKLVSGLVSLRSISATER